MGGRSIDVGDITLSTSGTSTYQPTINKVSATTGTDAAAGAATTTPSASGVYVAVQSSANTGTVVATGSVLSEGYISSGHPIDRTTNITVGASESSITYVPITTQTLATPTIAPSIETTGTASTLPIMNDTTKFVRITATETQTNGGWVVSGSTQSTTFDIPVFQLND